MYENLSNVIQKTSHDGRDNEWGTMKHELSEDLEL